MTKKPTELALYLSTKNGAALDIALAVLDRLRRDGYAFHPIPSKEEIAAEIKRLEKVKE